MSSIINIDRYNPQKVFLGLRPRSLSTIIPLIQNKTLTKLKQQKNAKQTHTYKTEWWLTEGWGKDKG